MTLLDRLLGHDAWTTGEILRRCGELTDEQLDREFDIGPRTVRRTLHHVVRNMEVWTDLMAGGGVRPDAGAAPEGRTLSALSARLAGAAADLARVARDIEARGAWDDLWTDHLDQPPTRKSYGGAIGHVLTHSMHHRAQLLYMLRRLGLADLPEGDLLGWEKRTGG